MALYKVGTTVNGDLMCSAKQKDSLNADTMSQTDVTSTKGVPFLLLVKKPTMQNKYWTFICNDVTNENEFQLLKIW
jgi:hypothetical protein